MGRLFDEADPANGALNAVVGSYREDDAILAYGYKHALDALVERWVGGDRFDPVLPVLVLLGRHAIELALKHAVRVADREARVLAATENLRSDLDGWLRRRAGHDLLKLREELERLLQVLGAQPLPDEVRVTIEELASVDPAGDTFRYSTTWDKDAGAHVPTPRPASKAGLVDVAALGGRLSHTANLLLVVEDVLTDGGKGP